MAADAKQRLMGIYAVGTAPSIPDRDPEGALSIVPSALDDLRRLGALDLEMNYD